MKRSVQLFIVCFLTTVGLCGGAVGAHASTLTVVPQQTTVSAGETFIVDVRLSSDQEVVNAAAVTLGYPTELLEATDVSRGGSFLTLWPAEPTIDPTAGTITLTGGIPHGSYVVDGKVISITFRAKQAGAATINIISERSSVHRNDGYGTAAALQANAATVQITAAGTSPLSSPTHPDESTWYADNAPRFVWSTKPGVDYSYLLSTNPDALPPDQRATVIGDVTFENVPDGIEYFILQERQPGKDWQPAGKLRVMIDTVPPLAIEARLKQEQGLYDGAYFLAFSTTDKTSGLSQFEVIEGGQTYHNSVSPYLLKNQTVDQAISVVAIDKAGNRTVATIRKGSPVIPAVHGRLGLYGIIVTLVLLTAALVLFRSRLRTKQ